MAFFKQLIPHQTLQQTGQTTASQLYVSELIKDSKPFALFRLPQTDTAHLMVSAKKELKLQPPDFRSEQPFFLVGPFFNDKKLAYSIPADYLLSFHIPMGITLYADKKSMEYCSCRKN